MRKYAFLVLGLLPMLATRAQTWNLTGNAGTNPSTNFIGTTDAQPLKFRVGNTASGEINSTVGAKLSPWTAATVRTS